MTIKSKAEFHRKLAPGMVFRCEHHQRPQASGEREVIKVQHNGLWYWFTKEDGQRIKGFTNWPPAGRIVYAGERVTFQDDQGRDAFTYDFSAVQP